LTAADIRELARECGFELAGVARAEPAADRARYHEWVAAGYAGRMGYLTDRRAPVRDDPRNLLASAQSVVCVGKVYQTAHPHTTEIADPERGWISRYAWGADYHDEMRRALERLDEVVRERAGAGYESKICVDTAPLLERSYGRLAGLGWIGKNTMLINQQLGSWFFVGELLVSVAIEPDAPPPDRCGTCTACIDACPTTAIGPLGVDATRCISYFTIELRGPVPEEHRPGIGTHVFGCDICQDVCPWNRRAAMSSDPAYEPREFAPPLDRLAAMNEEQFRDTFRGTPVTRARYAGFLRNVAVAMGNSGLAKFRKPLEQLERSAHDTVADAARWALTRLATDRPEL
jgi:epoxyqueuosine reductase